MNKPDHVFYDSSVDTKLDWIIATLEEMQERQADAIRAAVFAEREACAKLADEMWDGLGQKGNRADVAADIAAAIRERGQ